MNNSIATAFNPRRQRRGTFAPRRSKVVKQQAAAPMTMNRRFTIRIGALALLLSLLAGLQFVSAAAESSELYLKTRRASAEALDVAADSDAGANEQEASSSRASRNRTLSDIVFSRRDYFNGLVAMSVMTKQFQLSNIALMKTHKTGSTTLSALLFRYGRRHALEVAHFTGFHSAIPIAEAAKKTLESHNRLDIMHYHIGENGPLVGSTWEEAKALYKDVMRDPDNINFITILREPREHLMSYYSFFIEPITHVPIGEFLARDNPDEMLLSRLRNPACQEFGIYNEADLQDFVDNSIDGFKLVFITERFDEGLMVLRNLLNWHMIDMTYVFLNKTAGQLKNGNYLQDRSPFDRLPRNVQEDIDQLTVLDKKLYDAGVVAFEKSRAPFLKQVEADMNVFKLLQTVVNEYLDNNPKSKVNAMYRRAYYESPPPMLDF